MKEKDAGSQPSLNRPKTYLNYALFNDKFKLVEENSGVRQVQETPDQLQTLAADKIVMKESGFLYVYTSNETAQDVLFDNVAVVLEPGAVLEETHYYPFGLTMFGISVEAFGKLVNRRKYNTNELQNKEFASGEGINWDDFNARTYDQQIGRFSQIDPWVEVGEQEMVSPYHFAANNPIRYNDPSGRCPVCPIAIPIVVEALVGAGVIEAGAVSIGTVGIGTFLFNHPDVLEGAANVDFTMVPESMSHYREMQTQREAAAAAEKARIDALPVTPVKDQFVYDLVTNGGSPSIRMANKKGPKDLVQEALDQKAKQEAQQSRDANRGKATSRGNSRTGNSNQGTKGSHIQRGNGKSNKNDHEEADARRAGEQRAAADKKKADQKKN